MFDKPSIHSIFPTPVLETRLSDHERLNAALKSAIMAERSAKAGISRSNVHGWHSDTEMLRWAGEPARTVAMASLQLCGAHTHDRGLAASGKPRFEMGVEMWANVSPAGALNQVHAHPGCVWSAVYFVDDGGDDRSSLVLHDPRYPMNRMAAPDLVFAADGVAEEMKFEIAPAPGKLVAFPSWLMHSVKAHEGPRERISIAVNIMAIPVRPQQGGKP